MAEIRVIAWLGEGPFPNHRLTVLRKGLGARWYLFSKSINLIHESSILLTKFLPKDPTYSYHSLPLGIEIATCKFWEDTTIQIIANLDDIMQSKISQSPRDRYCVISLTQSTWSCRIQRQEVEWLLPGAGVVVRESVLSGDGVSVWKLKSSGDGWGWSLHNEVNALNATEPYT